MKSIIPLLISASVVLFSCSSCKHYYEKKARLEREAFVADSIAKREAFVADSIAAREAFVADSIAKRNAFVADSVAKAKHIRDVRNSVVIELLEVSDANSCGGRDVNFIFKNISKKTIKYLTMEVWFYNAVGDLVDCEIRDRFYLRGNVTGPIKPGETNYDVDSYFWECAIYNYQAKIIILKQISIEYMDGSMLHIPEEELKYIKGCKKYRAD